MLLPNVLSFTLINKVDAYTIMKPFTTKLPGKQSWTKTAGVWSPIKDMAGVLGCFSQAHTRMHIMTGAGVISPLRDSVCQRPGLSRSASSFLSNRCFFFVLVLVLFVLDDDLSSRDAEAMELTLTVNSIKTQSIVISVAL